MKYRTVKLLTLVTLLAFVCSNSSSLVSSQTPVYKDDFLCYDTTINWGVRFPQVSLGGDNVITQVNLYDTLSSQWEKYHVNGYTRFDLSGTQLQPYEFTSPIQVNDSFLTNTAYCIPRSNESGFTMITGSMQNSETYYNNEKYVMVLGSDGQILHPGKCLNCDDPNLGDYDAWEPYGAINNNSLVGLTWTNYEPEFNYAGVEDSVFVRLYDFVTDSLGPILSPLGLPLPEIDEPGYWGDYKPHPDVRMAIADDGTFVAVMRIWGDDFTRLFYVVYNADYTPRCEVQMPECSGSWSDTANCTGAQANYMDVVMEADGDFYIAWSVYQYSPYADVRNHVWVRGFHSDGSAKYDPVRVNDSDSLWFLLGDDLRPKVACDDYGNVLVSWHDARDYPGNYLNKPRNLYVQKVDPNGNLVGFNMRLNNHSGAAQSLWHSLDMNNTGQAIASWDYPFDSLPRVVAQLMPYDAVGRFVPGDINYDGSATIADVTTLIQYIFGGASTSNTFWPRSLSDYDGSGSTTIGDVIYMVQYIFAGGPAPITPDEGIRPNPGKFDLGG